MTELISHPLPAVVVLLGLLVLVHEAGHYFAGKAAGVAVEIFSIGFGPVIFAWKRKETDYRISWVPLGGFVKFYGSVPSEPVPDELKGKELYRAPLMWRAIIAAAGPIANFLLAIIAFAILGYVGVPQPRALVGDVLPDSPAERAGLDFGDEIVAINSKQIKNWRDFERKIASSANEELDLKVRRKDGSEFITKITPADVDSVDYSERKVRVGRIGISRAVVPATIAVLPGKNYQWLSQQALKTGQRIIGATTGSDSADVMKIDAWHELTKAFYQVRKSDAKNWTLLVVDELGQEQRLVLDLKTIGTPPIKSEKQSLKERSNDLEAIGIGHAQLVVQKPEEELKNLLVKGDLLLSIDGIVVADFFALRDVLNNKKDAASLIKVFRNGKEIDINVNLPTVEVQKVSGKVDVFTFPVEFAGMPFDPEPVIERYPSFISAVGYGLAECFRFSKDIIQTLAGLLTGQVSTKALGGPMLIAKIAGDSAKLGWQAFLTSLAIVSVNLGLLNLFPIPVLDGGQLVLILVEAVRRKALSEAAIENYQKIGFVLVMCLVVLATYNDLSRFWTSMLQSVRGIFNG